MKKNIKKILLVLIVFIVVYSLLILFSVNYADVTWNYGMSHAIKIGEIPYKDFNILMPPLSQYLMCILLFLKDSYLVFLFEQAILLPRFKYFLTNNEPQSGQVSPFGSAQRANEQSGYFEQPQKNVPYLDFLSKSSPSRFSS